MISGWEIIHNFSAHRLGKIWLCWDPGQVFVEPIHIHEQLITCKVTLTGRGGFWMLSIVYGATQGPNQRRLFQELSFVKGLVSQVPWLIIWDFNVIKAYQEKSGNAVFSGYENEFRDCLSGLEIEDLAATGCFHSWTNNQIGDAFVSKKLDRALSNLEWLQHFGNTAVEYFGERSFRSFSYSCYSGEFYQLWSKAV